MPGILLAQLICTMQLQKLLSVLSIHTFNHLRHTKKPGMLNTKGGEGMARMDVGARIRYFRHLRGLSQEQLALQAGLNTAFLGHLERGLKSPTITTLEKLVRALDITFEELFAEESSAADPERERALKQIELLTRELSAGQLDKLASIIRAILEFPQAARPSEPAQLGSDTGWRSSPAAPSSPR